LNSRPPVLVIDRLIDVTTNTRQWGVSISKTKMTPVVCPSVNPSIRQHKIQKPMRCHSSLVYLLSTKVNCNSIRSSDQAQKPSSIDRTTTNSTTTSTTTTRNTMNTTVRLAFLLLCMQGLLSTAGAWTSPCPRLGFTGTVTALGAGGGFGGGDKKGKDKRNKKALSSQRSDVKLKPKAQWDRFLDMKRGATRIRVAVKSINNNDNDGTPPGNVDGEWLEVGHIKSVDDAYTAMAVARQRALIAEHAKRLFPLQISPKDTIAWAYWDTQDETWKEVDKKILLDEENVPDGLEKLIGFEGRPDPNSGEYYWVYQQYQRSSNKKYPIDRITLTTQKPLFL